MRCTGVLVRISDSDGDDEELAVGRQEADCRKLASAHGWPVEIVYTERDTSAYRRKRLQLPDGTTGLRVVRPAFRQMLRDLSAGVIDALVVYDLDRLARDPRDLEDLIDVVESLQVPTRAVTGSFDLSTDGGVTMARVLVAMANKSSRDTARRVARKHQELAEAGRYGGGGLRSYGYTRSGQEVIPEEATILREIADRILTGDSLNRIAIDLSERKVPTATGATWPDGTPKAWSNRSVHSVITKARIAGLRVYKGEIYGASTWPAIIDRDTWERVCITLDDRAGGHSNTFRNWLSGVLLCGLCQSKLRGNTAHRGRAADAVPGPGAATHRYWCSPGSGGCGRLAISSHVEAVARRVILGYLSRPDVLLALQELMSSTSTATVRKDLQADEEQMQEMAAAYARRQMTMKEYMVARRIVEERMEGSKRILTATLPTAVRTVLHSEDIAEAFDSLSPSDKRDIARLVFPGGVYITPAKVRSRFEAERFVPAYSLDEDPRRVLKRLAHDATGKIQ